MTYSSLFNCYKGYGHRVDRFWKHGWEKTRITALKKPVRAAEQILVA
jgi:hypothetical protein